MQVEQEEATVDALRIRKRIETGHEEKLGRTKRKYDKHDNDFWELKIISNRKEKARRILQEQMDANENLDDLTAGDIKLKFYK